MDNYKINIHSTHNNNGIDVSTKGTFRQKTPYCLLNTAVSFCNRCVITTQRVSFCKPLTGSLTRKDAGGKIATTCLQGAPFIKAY